MSTKNIYKPEFSSKKNPKPRAKLHIYSLSVFVLFLIHSLSVFVLFLRIRNKTKKKNTVYSSLGNTKNLIVGNDINMFRGYP